MAMPNKKKGQPINTDENNKNAETNSTPDSKLDIKTKTLTVNVFFDGTANNMFNTQHRLDDEELAAKAREKARLEGKSIAEQNKAAENAKVHSNLEDQGSYGNDFSNVALLFDSSQDDLATVISIYVPGAGTITGEKDAPGGLAAATGQSGIMDRVYEAFDKITKKLKRLETKPSKLVFNVFGFSRGSFYGRFFCALLKKDPKTDKTADHYPSFAKKVYDYTLGLLPLFNNALWYNKDGIPINTDVRSFSPTGRSLLEYSPKAIRINMVGIYDTVASHGWSHNNDSEYFELDIGQKQQIAKVVHITAQNEYRNHFSLVETNSPLTWRHPSTNKNTLLGEAIGFQCSLPGAHADIGGCYIKKINEKDLYLSNYDPPKELKSITHIQVGEIYWEWFVNKGYYTTDPNRYYSIRAKQSGYKIQQSLLEQARQNGDEKAIKANEIVLEQNKKDFENTINSYEPKLLPKEEITQGELTVVKKTFGGYEVRANRTVNGNAYQYIPLKLMHVLAEDKGVPKFNNVMGMDKLEQAYADVNADPILARFSAYVVGQGLKCYKTESAFDFNPEDAGLTKFEQQYMYHEYIHTSLQAEFRADPKNFFLKYVTNGSQNYNKDLDTFEPIRVTVDDNAVGVRNQRRNERILAERAEQQEKEKKDGNSN